MWFLSIFLNSDLCVQREARWAGLFHFSVPARSHALYYIRRTRSTSRVTSVEHVLRPGSHVILYYIILYYIILYYIILYYIYYVILYYILTRRSYLPSPPKTKPKDFLHARSSIHLVNQIQRIFCN